jgi:hypothetical protein
VIVHPIGEWMNAPPHTIATTGRMKATLCLVFAACTSQSPSAPDPDDPTTITADDVLYDNDTSQLASSTVQGALDDVSAAAVANEDRLSQLEARKVIYCRFSTSSFAVPAGVPVPHRFTAEECGGSLPDVGYVGALSRATTCTRGSVIADVANAGDSDGPGIVLFKNISIVNCSGPAVLAAVFHPI